MFLTIAFYQFVSLKNIDQLQAFIFKFCQKNSIKGTILLASEGINGTISGDEKKIQKFLHMIDFFYWDVVATDPKRSLALFIILYEVFDPDFLYAERIYGFGRS